MPLPKDRSNSVRKVKRRMPGGKSAVRYVRRVKGGKHSCASCGMLLQGTHSHSTLSASMRKPNRVFGGNLCHDCARRVLVYKARIEAGIISQDEVEVKLLPYVKGKK